MKTYKAVLTFMADPENPNEITNGSAMDLVNVADDTDRIMCGEDEFEEGEIVTEAQIELKECNYVYDEGIGSADFAFKL